MAIKFTDNSAAVKGAMHDAAMQFLEESAMLVQRDAAKNTASASGQLKGSWDHIVDSGELKATVGNPSEYAIWQEMGTGEYALNGNGRKGYWVYVEGGSGGKSGGSSKQYTLQEAKRVVAMLRSKGLAAVYTKGSKPQRMLHKAYTNNKSRIIQRASQIFKGRIG